MHPPPEPLQIRIDLEGLEVAVLWRMTLDLDLVEAPSPGKRSPDVLRLLSNRTRQIPVRSRINHSYHCCNYYSR